MLEGTIAPRGESPAGGARDGPVPLPLPVPVRLAAEVDRATRLPSAPDQALPLDDERSEASPLATETTRAVSARETSVGVEARWAATEAEGPERGRATGGGWPGRDRAVRGGRSVVPAAASPSRAPSATGAPCRLPRMARAVAVAIAGAEAPGSEPPAADEGQ